MEGLPYEDKLAHGSAHCAEGRYHGTELEAGVGTTATAMSFLRRAVEVCIEGARRCV